MAKSIKFKNDTYLDSTSIVHDKTNLSDILNYSTQPVAIGKWVDGKKTVYRQIFYNENENVASILIDFNFADIVLNVYGYVRMSGGNQYFINGGNASYSENKDWFIHATWIDKNSSWKGGYVYIFPGCNLSDKIVKHCVVVEWVQ